MKREQRELLNKVKRALIENNKWFDELEGIGIMGSLIRKDFKIDRSDIDIFVVAKEYQENWTEIWYHRVREMLRAAGIHRYLTVIVYDIPSLKKIPTWHTLRMATDGLVVWDSGMVKKIFSAIVKAAKRAGLHQIKIGDTKVWAPKKLLDPGEIIEFEVDENDL